MTPPHLTLLGGFDYTGPAAAMPDFSRKARAMLAYLALQSGRTQSREKLAALLWGGTGEAQARMNLRQALSTIKKAMRAADGEWLVTKGDAVTLTLEGIDIDVARFEALAAGSTCAQLEQAISVYRGELLDGFGLNEEPFEDWLRLERERLRAIAVGVLEKLVARYSTQGDLPSCVRVATRLLALEPLREDVHRALMRAYAAQGRINLALRQYEHCSDSLQKHLGLQPQPETRHLYEDLRSRRMRSKATVSTGQDPASAPDLLRSGQSRATERLQFGVGHLQAPTHYVKSAESNIAYQVTGDGPVDMVYVPGWVSNLDYAWASPRLKHVLDRLGCFCRLIRIDKRGTGLSDRNFGVPTLEERMQDVRAVLDAIGSKRTVLFGSSEGGNMCMLFAATYPERTAALVLNGAYARGMWAHDYPWAKTREQVDDDLARIEREWGAPADLVNAAPSLMNDAFEREWFAAYLRNSASPADAISLWRWGTEIDVRDILPAIHVPALIVQRTGDRWVKAEEGRYLAKHIAGARYVELAGDDHVIWGADSDRLVDEIQAFVAGASPTPGQRVLLTVLHAQIGDMKSIPAGTGDGNWRDLMPWQHDEVRRQLHLAEGTEIEATTNGFVAVFQRPTRALQCALSIRSRLHQSGMRVRAAVHVGECEKSRDGVTGVAIQLARGLLDRAGPGEVVATRTVRDLVVGADLIFDERGEMELGDVPGMWPFYRVAEPAI
jgi:DNA-binding SARP family transcriptional activator/pimeloyl-ACP methyl ester carboxylesterase